MDGISAGLAKELVNNSPQATVLEFYQTGPKLKFDWPAFIAVTGFNFKLVVDGSELPLYTVHRMQKAQTLEIKSVAATNFGYLSVGGGFDSESRLGSSSYCVGITDKHRLQKGQVLKFHQTDLKDSALNARIRPNDELFKITALKVTKGPEFELLSARQQELFLNQPYELSRNISRMGFRFKSNDKASLRGILTGPVQAGTIQLTPGGELIALMRDSQTTGGYARIFQLLPREISLLSQQIPGTKLQFKLFE